MVAMNKSSIGIVANPTQITDEENPEDVPLVEKKTSSIDDASASSSAPKKPIVGLGESPAFWLFMLFLASVTMTVGNKYVMKAWGDFANTLTLLQNGTAVLYLALSRHLGMMEMKPITGQQ